MTDVYKISVGTEPERTRHTEMAKTILNEDALDAEGFVLIMFTKNEELKIISAVNMNLLMAAMHHQIKMMANIIKLDNPNIADHQLMITASMLLAKITSDSINELISESAEPGTTAH